MVEKDVVVWKYPLKIQQIETLRVPKKSGLLDVVVQYGVPTAYFMVEAFPNDTLDFKEVSFVLVGTGNYTPKSMIKGMSYVASLVLRNDTFVVHVFTNASRMSEGLLEKKPWKKVVGSAEKQEIKEE